jgi:hypothetical protein
MIGHRRLQTNFCDCYVLSIKRTKEFIHSFLEHFLPDASAYTSEYQVPELAEQPLQTFTSADALIDYLESHPEEPHAIYWFSKHSTLTRSAMCLFMNDGAVLYGLATESLFPDTSIEDQLLQQLMNFCNSQQGLILYEEPAPRTTHVFLYMIAQKNKG